MMSCQMSRTVDVCARSVGDAFDQAHAALGPTPADSTLICGSPPLRMPPPLHPEGAGGSDICGAAGGDGAGGDGFGGSSDIGTGVGASSDVGGVGAVGSTADSTSADVGAGPSGAGGFGELKGRGGAGGAW
jgi:hypothetical protein